MNRIFSLIIVILLLPVFFITSVLICLEDGLPIFFIQKRVGKDNKLFHIFKFRTMSKDTPDIPTHMLKKVNVSYTQLGPILRKLSIDEIPQLFNIILGDMKFIGPRPALYNQEDLIQLRKEKDIHSLYPGITGWAQVNGRDNISISKKVELDLYYKNNKSAYLDVKILLLTFLKVLRSEDVS